MTTTNTTTKPKQKPPSIPPPPKPTLTHHLTTSIIITVTATSTVESIILRPEGNNIETYCIGKEQVSVKHAEPFGRLVHPSPWTLLPSPVPQGSLFYYSDLIDMSVGLM